MRSTIIVALALLVIGPAGTSHSEESAFRGDIEKLTEQNPDFQHVTGRNVQVVAMSLRPGEELGEEVHKVDKCFFFMKGTAQTIVGANTATLGRNGVLRVPAGTRARSICGSHGHRGIGAGGGPCRASRALRARAPETISIISWVIASRRAAAR